MADEHFEFIATQFNLVIGADPAEITRDSQFGADLEADSVDLIEVVAGVERRFGVPIDDHELYDLENVGQLVDLIERKVADAGS